MPDRAVPVEWQVAEDERFRRSPRGAPPPPCPRSATAFTWTFGGCARAVRTGTASGPTASSRRSAAPAPPAAGRLRRACASRSPPARTGSTATSRRTPTCCAQDPDVVALRRRLHLRVRARRRGRARRTRAPASRTPWSEYRNRYAQYRTDPDLRPLHAAVPWIVTFDDHEVDNDWAGEIPQDPDKQPHDAFVARLTAAFQAYYEHMPVRAAASRRPAHPDVPALRLRPPRPAQRARHPAVPQRPGHQPGRRPGPVAAPCSAPSRSSGSWTGCRDSPARWNLIASQIMMAETDLLVGPGKLWYYDAWDGYQAERNALLERVPAACATRSCSAATAT